MRSLLMLSIIMVVMTGSVIAQADSTQPIPPVPPCEIPEMRQFDFWLGEWDLTWSDTVHGSNTITADLDNCVIVERFDGYPGTPMRGMSVSTYNKNTGKWHQTWVDNQGGYLDFTGEFADGKMILSREATRDEQMFLQRMVWFDITADSLLWNWENSIDNGETWNTLWAIKYKRK